MKLPRLQLHLSTWLIVSLLAAGLVWLNVRGAVFTTPVELSHVKFSVVHKGFGWPYCFWFKTDESSEIVWSTVGVNIALCLALLALAGAALEWLTRRMKRGAP